MPLKYQQHLHLAHPKGHSDAITVVVFSPSGLLLASGGLDGRVCVWDTATARLRHVVCGMENGTISSLMITQDTIDAAGLWAHDNPVESLAYNGSHLASGAHDEVKIWSRKIPSDSWTEVAEIDPPPSSSLNAACDVIVTSLHWTTTRRRPSVVVVTYLNHGITIVDGRTWERVRSIAFPGYIADADLSTDGKLLAISNMLTGFEVFTFKALTELEPLCSFNQDDNVGYTLPVRFTHGGNAVIGGTSKGRMSLWDINTRRKQRLIFDGPSCIRAIAPCYIPADDALLIATGHSERGTPSSIVIWKAQEISHANKGSISGDRTAGKSTLIWMLQWTISCLAIVLVFMYIVELCDVVTQ